MTTGRENICYNRSRDLDMTIVHQYETLTLQRWRTPTTPPFTDSSKGIPGSLCILSKAPYLLDRGLWTHSFSIMAISSAYTWWNSTRMTTWKAVATTMLLVLTAEQAALLTKSSEALHSSACVISGVNAPSSLESKSSNMRASDFELSISLQRIAHIDMSRTLPTSIPESLRAFLIFLMIHPAMPLTYRNLDLAI